MSVQRRLTELLQRGDYDKLDAAIASLQDRFDRGAISEDLVVAGYNAFAPAPWGIEAKLDAWVARAPDRYQARLARGLYYYDRAVLLRGTLPDDEVDGQRLVNMRNAFDRSLRDLQAALAQRPRLSAAWQASLYMAVITGDNFEILHSYRAGVAAIPESTVLPFAYAYALWRQDLLEALQRFVEQIAAKPPGRDPRFAVFPALPDFYAAESLVQIGDTGAAISKYNSSLRIADWPWARARRGMALLDIGRVDDGERDLQQALKARPWSAEGWFFLGIARVDKGDQKQALAYWQKAIDLDPMNPSYRSTRATLLVEMGRVADALADLEVALVYGADDPAVHAARSGALMERNPQEALRSIEIARRLDPNSTQMQLLYVNALYLAHDCSARPALMRYVAMCSQRDACGGEVPYWDEQIRQLRCQAPP